MLVIIPTFKRIDRLQWTLLSLLRNKKPDINESCRVVIANNYPPSKTEIEKLVANIRKKYKQFDFWEWIIVHRPKTIDAAENCLSAIQEFAEYNEVFLVQGDDDLFTPWSINVRAESIVQTLADILLTKSKFSLWYLNKDGKVYFGDDIPSKHLQKVPKELDWSEIDTWGATFLGNNCYRYTEKIQQALELIYEWLRQQTWLDFNTSSMMWPFYFPYALKKLGGSVYGLDQFCVIRGNLLKERVEDPFEVSFNTGLISLCAYGVLNNNDLRPIQALDDARKSLEEYISEWLIPLFIDKRVPKQVRFETLKNIPYSLKKVRIRGLFRGIKRSLKSYLGLQLLLTRMRASKSKLTIYELLDKIDDCEKLKI